MLKIEKCDAEFKADQLEVDTEGELLFDLFYFSVADGNLNIERWGNWSWITYPKPPKEALCDAIIKCVAKHYDLEEMEICEHSSLAHDIAIYLTERIIGISQSEMLDTFKVWEFDLLKFETLIDEKMWRDISEILIDINTAMYWRSEDNEIRFPYRD